MYFTKEIGFSYDIRSENSIEISKEYWIELLNQQNDGKKITYDKNGYPIAIDYVITDEERDKINQVSIMRLINEASREISILQDTVDLDMALDGDEDKLTAWKKYRVLLSRVDTNVEEMELPEKPE